MNNKYDWFMSEEYTVLYLSEFDDWRSHNDIVSLTEIKHPGRIEDIGKRVDIAKARYDRRRNLATQKRNRLLNRLHKVPAAAVQNIDQFGIF